MCSQKNKIEEGYYEANFIYAKNNIEINMQIDKQIGFITVEESFSKDSIVSCQVSQRC
jgi:hypothetical protein